MNAAYFAVFLYVLILLYHVQKVHTQTHTLPATMHP